MFDIKLIRECPDKVRKGLAAKNVSADLDHLIDLDQKRRRISIQLDDLRSQKNKANDEITQALKAKQDPKGKIASMKTIAKEIDLLEPEEKEIDRSLNETLLRLPNLPHESVPPGDVSQNKVVRAWGVPKKFDFKPKNHIELAEHLDIMILNARQRSPGRISFCSRARARGWSGRCTILCWTFTPASTATPKFFRRFWSTARR